MCFNGVCVQFCAAELFSCPCGVLSMRLHAINAMHALGGTIPSICQSIRLSNALLTLNDLERRWQVMKHCR